MAGHRLAGVTDPGGGPEQHRQFEFFRELVSRDHQFFGLAGTGRIQDRDFAEHGEKPAVLFGLGAVRSGVIGDDDQKAAFNSEIGGAQKGIGGDIQSHLLHGDSGALAGIAVPQGDFVGHLFVEGPFGVELDAGFPGKSHHGTKNFGGGGAGVGSGQGAAGLDEAPGNGFVAHEDGGGAGRGFRFGMVVFHINLISYGSN